MRHLISVRGAAVPAPTFQIYRALHRAAGIVPIITGQTLQLPGCSKSPVIHWQLLGLRAIVAGHSTRTLKKRLLRSRAKASTNTHASRLFDLDSSLRLECTTKSCLDPATTDCPRSRPRNSPRISRHKGREECFFAVPSSRRVGQQPLRLSPPTQDEQNTVPVVEHRAPCSIADDSMRLEYRTPPSPKGPPLRTPTEARAG
jgi:hypothetical protein